MGARHRGKRGFDVLKSTNKAGQKISPIKRQPRGDYLLFNYYVVSSFFFTVSIEKLIYENYATFYNYDAEGILVQVKKETERGVSTIKTARSNTKRISQ